ncbi:alpha/beta fold hydrolase BchO [Sphingomonas sp. 1P06PA]|uniref:alpha/beta fold hydrolase BchO n=1 Tax=Sphingomonas sp. 1P06PA TaxID=554121 RepID=UPI0039A51DA7
MSYRPRWAVEGRDWPLRPHSRFVTVGPMRWHVQMLGSGPPALLLHGTGAATHSWRGLAPLLAERFTMIAPDLPGHGFTEGRPPGGHGLPATARAVSALLAELGVAPTLAIGHSAGSAIAIRMALDGGIAPDALVGLSPALAPFPGIARKLFPGLAKLLFVNPLMPSILSRIAGGPDEVRRFLLRATASPIDQEGVDCYAALFATPAHCAGALAMMAHWDLEPLERDLARLRPQVLLIHGAADPAIPTASVRSAAARMPAATLDVLPGLGHLAHEEGPDLIADRILAFAACARSAPIVETVA